VLFAALAGVCLAQGQEQADRDRAAARAAIEAHDDSRIIEYGERVLERQPDDLQILEQVTRALLAGGSKEAWERALKYARRYEELVRQMQKDNARAGVPSGPSAAQWRNETDRGLGRALCDEARASGNLGRLDEALALAQRAFEIYPSADSARETAHWYERLGKPEEAARVLEAYDRNVALIRTRELTMRESDPNAQLTDPMEFTLTGLDGQKLTMASLKGKVVVFDFWATWCEPCRGQHPLYAQVKQRFKDNSDVVFLSIDTDEDREPVRRFLEEEKWPDQVYFEDGLSRALRIATIPTTIVIEKRGRVFSRMNGYVPQRFVELLTGRISDALGQ
jgi:thiol-disulfide isomerase/thioredoxin